MRVLRPLSTGREKGSRQPAYHLPMITRQDALRIGGAEILARGLGAGAREALLVDEINSSVPRIYGTPDLEAYWIVYADHGAVGVIRSGHVVLVARKTGRVMHAGSASDEG